MSTSGFRRIPMRRNRQRMVSATAGPATEHMAFGNEAHPVDVSDDVDATPREIPAVDAELAIDISSTDTDVEPTPVPAVGEEQSYPDHVSETSAEEEPQQSPDVTPIRGYRRVGIKSMTKEQRQEYDR